MTIEQAERKIAHLEQRHMRHIEARDTAQEAARAAQEDLEAIRKRLDELNWHLRVPDGARRLDAWECNGELIVCGDPPEGNGDVDDPRQHNCDAMGCSSVSHVIVRMSMAKAMLAHLDEAKP